MKRTKYYLGLWITCLIGLAAPVRAADNPVQRETELLREVRRQKVPHPYTLAQLAFTRERRNRYRRAIETWHLVKRLHYGKMAPNQSSAPSHTYGQIADFYLHRLRRKQRLAANPPRLNNALRRKLAKSRLNVEIPFLRREGGIDLIVEVDLDGDLIDEVFAVGKYGPVGKRNEPFMCIAKWDGRRYKVVWRAEGKHQPRMFPHGYTIVDEDGDGWKEISCNFEPETDNVATLRFNGIDAMMLWLSG